MSEENNLTSQADELPPASQKTKEQWLDEGHLLAFYAPIRSEEGLAAYEQAIRLDPTYGLAWRMKGYTLSALRRYEEALAAYEQAISLDATDAEAYTGKGDTLYALKRYEEALKAYEQALHLDPTSAGASNGKAISLVFLNQDEEALAAYAQVLRLDDDPVYSWTAYKRQVKIEARHERTILEEGRGIPSRVPWSRISPL